MVCVNIKALHVLFEITIEMILIPVRLYQTKQFWTT